MKCYGQTRGAGWVQEWYETASHDAGKRARECRKAGLVARSSAMGMQVTGVGRVRMSLVDIRGEIDNLPHVDVLNI